MVERVQQLRPAHRRRHRLARALAGTNANWAGLLVTQYQDNIGSTVIAPRTAEMKTPTDASLRFAIRELRARGMQGDAEAARRPVGRLRHWRGQINPTNVDAWFRATRQFIVHYAQLAQEEGVEAYVVGTELVMMTGSANRARWNAVFDAVRAPLRRPLWSTPPTPPFRPTSSRRCRFWDRVDVIGLDALLHAHQPRRPDAWPSCSAAWTSNANGENIVAAIQNVSPPTGKPVIFTELGYKSVPGANTDALELEPGRALRPHRAGQLLRRRLHVWSTRTSFMKGIFWWAWPVPVPAANDLDYNPRTKPAEAVLRTWQGPVGTANFTLSATPGSLTVNRARAGPAPSASRAREASPARWPSPPAPCPAGVTACFTPASDHRDQQHAHVYRLRHRDHRHHHGHGDGHRRRPHPHHDGPPHRRPGGPARLHAAATPAQPNREPRGQRDQHASASRARSFTGGVSFTASRPAQRGDGQLLARRPPREQQRAHAHRVLDGNHGQAR